MAYSPGRALIIDLQRLCYLQLELTRITALSECGLQILYTLVMALKATAWRGVLIAQFGEYFDDALYPVINLVTP